MPKRVDLGSQRRAITDAAISVINQAGLDGARLRDVARAANVTTGAVMHYFDGKDAVLEAALEEIVRRTLQRMQAAPEPATPLDAARFVSRVCAYLPLDEHSRREWRVWLAFWGRAIGDPRLRAVHRAHYARIVERLIGHLRSLRRSAAPLSRQQLRRHADALIAAIDGVGTRATLEPELWPPKRQRETLAGLLLPMLSAFAQASEPL